MKECSPSTYIKTHPAYQKLSDIVSADILSVSWLQCEKHSGTTRYSIEHCLMPHFDDNWDSVHLAIIGLHCIKEQPFDWMAFQWNTWKIQDHLHLEQRVNRSLPLPVIIHSSPQDGFGKPFAPSPHFVCSEVSQLQIVRTGPHCAVRPVVSNVLKNWWKRLFEMLILDDFGLASVKPHLCRTWTPCCNWGGDGFG